MYTQPQQQRTQSVGVPAPLNGIMATSLFGNSSGSMAEGDAGPVSAIWLYNMIPGEFGCRVRQGSRERATGIPDIDSPFGTVRTVLFFNSVLAGGLQDRLFAVTNQGIFDVSAGGTAPWVPVLEWPNQGLNAGWCASVNYTNVAGDHFLLVCDEANGYYIYDGVTFAPGTFTGNPKPDPADLVHICEWNSRIWFVEKNTARAWFLDPLALTGDITPFDVGSRFQDGGHLVQCATWTLDDGAGMDDKFVMVSASGDLLVWAGIDPTVAADLTLIGRWQVGSVPEGRRVMSEWGGDVLILSTSGLVTLQALMQNVASLSDEKYLSKNINAYIRSEMAQTLNEYGWSLQLVPGQGIAVITVPQPDNSTRAPIQFVLDITTSAWCMFRGLDIVGQARVGDRYYFGTRDGRIMEMTGALDDVSLDGLTGKAIPFSMLTHYSGLGDAATWKRPQFIRPYWIGASQPIFSVQIRFDFDLAELSTAPAYLPRDLSQWDFAIWDADVWEGTAQSYLETIACSGMGRHMAIAIRGQSSNSLAYVGADVMYQSGGML